MPTNERPGVYTGYQVTSAVTGRSGGGAVGLAARAEGESGKVTRLGSYAEAVAAFGGDSALTKLTRLALLNGAERVHAVAVPGDTDELYEAAFALLQGDEEIRVMLCDSRAPAVHAAMKESIESAPEMSKYRIGIVEGNGGAGPLIAAAAALNSERMVLCTPSGGAAGEVAAALAGVVAGSSDPALPVSGAVLYGLSEVPALLSDSDVNALVRGGVTAVEHSGGETSVVRGVTTRTTTGGVADSTWRELSTTLIVDDVIPSVRAALRSRFSRSKNTAQTRGAIRTQVIIELENKLAREIIDSYGEVSAQPDPEDPTVCVVRFGFTVAHGLNQVHLTANITV